MTIGVPVCRDSEACGAVAARLTPALPVVVALDEDGMACGWATRAHLLENVFRLVGDVLDEEIPTIGPEATLAEAAEVMRQRGVDYLFLMHSWPGEPRPSAVISRRAVEEQRHGVT